MYLFATWAEATTGSYLRPVFKNERLNSIAVPGLNMRRPMGRMATIGVSTIVAHPEVYAI